MKNFKNFKPNRQPQLMTVIKIKLLHGINRWNYYCVYQSSGKWFQCALIFFKFAGDSKLTWAIIKAKPIIKLFQIIKTYIR